MKTIRVWDPLVRLLHWTLVICVFSNLLNESGATVHHWLGYSASAAVLLRVAWGFVGTQHARFSDWFPTPSRLFPYLKALLKRQEPRYLGHNPAGAVMMIALMAIVASLGITGYLMTTEAFFGEEWLESLHGGLADTLIVLVALHVSAALIDSWKYKENLIASMLHGRKRVDLPDEMENRNSSS